MLGIIGHPLAQDLQMVLHMHQIVLDKELQRASWVRLNRTRRIELRVRDIPYEMGELPIVQAPKIDERWPIGLIVISHGDPSILVVLGKLQ